MDSLLEVSCTVKPAVYLSVPSSAGAATSAHRLEKWENGDSGANSTGCQVVDVDMHSPVPESIDYVIFRNHYTHTVTLKYCSLSQILNSNPDCQNSNSKPDHPPTATQHAHTPSQWRTCLKEHRLMADCHRERGSQRMVVLNHTHFPTPLHCPQRLRLILRQPSLQWAEFGIRDLHCYTIPTPLHWNGKLGMGVPDLISISGSSGGGGVPMSVHMERVLRNGLCPTQVGTESDEEQQQPIRTQYRIDVLSWQPQK